MQRLHSWDWVEEQVARSADSWNGLAPDCVFGGSFYPAKEQARREQAYDRALQDVEREAKSARSRRADRSQMQERVIGSLARFAATALGLEPDAVELLTQGFVPIGVDFARRAQQFDASLSQTDIVQACRNAWTVCGLQPLLGDGMGLTPSVVGYSLLYPYSDNFLDSPKVSADRKRHFSWRFLARLHGDLLPIQNRHEDLVWNLVAMIESQYPRESYPDVFECLVAIHRAQEESMAQLKNADGCGDDRVLEISCAKGGSSVVADACLCHGWLTGEESEFAFDWGVLLQLGDDLQDVREDISSGSRTLFSNAAAARIPLDELAARLLNLSDRVSAQMDALPHGSRALKALLRMSWRQLVVMAVANWQEYFSPRFAAELERQSPFRFAFLRAKQKRIAARRGLYANLFDVFLDARLGSAVAGPYGVSGALSASVQRLA
jgi:hypothetical protein